MPPAAPPPAARRHAGGSVFQRAVGWLEMAVPEPVPELELPRFHSDAELSLELPPALREWVLRAAQSGGSAAASADVSSVDYYDNYNLPSAIRVELTDGRGVALRRGSRSGSVSLEAAAFALLADVGLPVPTVLAGPAGPSELPGEADDCLLVAELPGINLQKLSMIAGETGHAARLLGEAVDRLLAIGPACRAHPAAGQFPVLSLRDELCEVEAADNGAGWLRHPEFASSYRATGRLLADAEHTERQFTALFGDLQPANFLAARGEAHVEAGWQLTGFLDYEGAAFRDVLLGLAKYKTHDLHPLNKAGAVEAWLAKRGVPSAQFAVRVAVWCLRTLAKEVAPPPGQASGGDGETRDGGDDEAYREHLLHLLRESLQECTGGSL